MNIQKRPYSDAPAALSSPATTATYQTQDGTIIFSIGHDSPAAAMEGQQTRETRSEPGCTFNFSVERHNREPDEAFSGLCRRPDAKIGVTYTFDCDTKKWQRLYDLRPVPTRRERVLLHHRNREEPFGGGGDDWRCREREGSEGGMKFGI
ncbi:thioredoxin [Sesbania bispinosa]|nr:thioredoxin [Sesbania bispinosa]